MAVDSQIPRSRRNLLVMAFGGVAGVVATMVSRAAPAAAVEGQIVHVGDDIGGATSMTAIRNTTNDADVIRGRSDGAGIGIHGMSEDGAAIWGGLENGHGVMGASSQAPGVEGQSDNNDGVRGGNAVGNGAGVHGIAHDPLAPVQGVLGESKAPRGLGVEGINSATSGKAIGARATSSSPDGLGAAGWAKAGGGGVIGASGARFPSVKPKTGVYGYAPQGRGGLFAGGPAQLRLVPSTDTTHPASGLTGDLFLDSHARLWFCKGGSSWVRLA